ncbi:MAG: hypothetical protein IJO11_02645 [Alphaproteobacteria bacterium]|nr:hypothetical protein [Alphaproteobacteria bacterium]
MENTTQKYTNARLLAVQAVYTHALLAECEMPTDSWEKIVSRFLMGEVGGEVIKDGIAGREEYIPLEAADAKLFTKLTQAVQERETDLDEIIRTNISEKVDYERLELPLKCILKVGLAEFYANPNLDAPIIINEYVDMTRSFFDGPEHKMVNALLDKFSRVIRG